MKKSTGIVMAAGLSRRFGGNKLLSLVKGRPLFSYVVQAALASELDYVAVVSQYPEILQYATQQGLTAVSNPDASLGQSQSVVKGVAASSPSSHFMFLAADQPNLTPEIINCLLEEGKKHPRAIVIPTVNKAPATPTLFPPHLRDELLQVTGDQGGRQVILAHPKLVRYIEVAQGHLLQDIDTREELDQLSRNDKI